MPDTRVDSVGDQGVVDPDLEGDRPVASELGMGFAKHPKRARKNQEAEPRLPELDRVVGKFQNVGEHKQRRQDAKPGRRYRKQGAVEPWSDNPSLAGAPAPSGV